MCACYEKDEPIIDDTPGPAEFSPSSGSIVAVDEWDIGSSGYCGSDGDECESCQ